MMLLNPTFRALPWLGVVLVACGQPDQAASEMPSDVTSEDDAEDVDSGGDDGTASDDVSKDDDGSQSSDDVSKDDDGSQSSDDVSADDGGAPPNDDDGDDSSEPGAEPEPDVSEPSGPHALGVITLGELRLGGEVAVPYVTAYFMPTAGVPAAACVEDLGPCTVAKVPNCDPACSADEYCGFDAACSPQCQPVCSLSCRSDEYCAFAASGAPECRVIESFDAGTLRFTGTSSEITVPPPYTSAEGLEGSAFGSGDTLTVQASGASRAGFEAFEQSFRATSLVQPEPPLDELSLESVFGEGDLVLQWAPGADTVMLQLTATAGSSFVSLNCEADDSSGRFTLPRSTLRAAVGGGDLSSLAVTITRTRTETYEGFSTLGQLQYAEVEPSGWLQLNTSSAVSHSFIGCQGDSAACGSECVDLSSDEDHCGTCGNACAAGSFGCVAGQCQLCGDDYTDCSGECVSLDDDREHCGACGTACGANEECNFGECLGCDAGYTLCDGYCVDLQSDYDNCGMCGRACEYCIDGRCTEDACPAGMTDCEGECANLSSDPFHCGECFLECGGAPCSQGVCDGGEWTCDAELRNDGDCDCGCGTLDPDCSSRSSAVCDYCNCDELGYCDLVDPNDNTQCQ